MTTIYRFAKQLLLPLLETLTPSLELSLRARNYRRKKAEEELNLLEMLVHRTATAIDVGGNHGAYAYFLQSLCDQLIVIEPNPTLAKKLQRSLRKNIQIKQLAVSNAKGQVQLRLPVSKGKDLTGLATIEASNTLASMESVELIEVRTTTLDDVATQNVGFIKIDVEGHELAALQGATRLLSESKPTLLIEAEERHRPHAVKSITEFLSPYGYEGFYYIEDHLFPVHTFQPEYHQNLSRLGVSSGPQKYVNNFIYIANSSTKSRVSRIIKKSPS